MVQKKPKKKTKKKKIKVSKKGKREGTVSNVASEF